MKKYIWLAIGLILAIVFGPVLLAQANPPESRSYEGVHLDELEYQEISFRNEAQDLSLGGMLFVPEGEGPFPAVVFIHGSGTSRRDNIWYLTLTAHLQENGVAVLLPDKRGSEKSEGDWHTSSFDDLATDTLAAIDFLNTQSRINVSQIGIIGMSQGGWIAPIVATESSEVDYLINVVGTSVTTYEQVAYEEVHNLRQVGFLPGVADAISYPALFLLREFVQKNFWDAVGNFDPLPYWREVEIPVLVLYGSDDTNVPSEASRARFESLNKENIQVRVYTGSGHALQDPPGSGDSIFRDKALTDIQDFINTVAPPAINFETPNFVFQGEDPSSPIVTHNPSPEIDNQYINPGAVLFHDGQFHMFFNSFTSWPGVIETGYMTSEDGYHWQMVQEAPIFTSDQIPFGNGHADVSSALVLEDGTWVLYFHTISHGQIGRATAASPLGPWTVDGEPVLEAGPDGSWDNSGVFWPSIVKDENGYRMYYGGRTLLNTAIGFATSADGIHWTKYDDPETVDDAFQQSDPILTADADWDQNKVDRPRVTRSPEGWVMIYQGGPIEMRGLALSLDGVNWKTYPSNPLFTSESFPIPNAKTWDTNLLYLDGTYYYFMELGTLNGTDLYLTTHRGDLRK